METASKLAQLLPHWIEHNEEHAAQLDEWAAKARGSGMTRVAEAIAAASEALRRANASLAEARQRARQ